MIDFLLSIRGNKMAKTRRNKQPIRIISWEYFQDMLDELANRIISLGHIRRLYGVPRGGSIVAICLTHVDNRLHMDDAYPTPIHVDICGPVIIVDDIVDSGKTCERFNNNFAVASLFYRKGASFEPDFYAEKIEDNTWIKFPWERE